MDKAQQFLSDQLALRQTAELYAQGADRRDKDIWASVLAEDCVIEGPGFCSLGLDDILPLIDRLADMFVATRHNVMNQTVNISGDSAIGETYCIADHATGNDPGSNILSWHIRYQDEWRRGGETGWLFTRRLLILDWEEMRNIHVSNHQENAA